MEEWKVQESLKFMGFRHNGHEYGRNVDISSDTYDYIFGNTHSMSVIGINRRGGIAENKLTFNRKLRITLRKTNLQY